MNKFSISLLALLALAGTASARLGETVDEVEARYGKSQPVSETGAEEQRSYQYEGYAVQVAFVNGKSAYELIIPAGDRQKISDVETLAFARALSGSEDWVLATKEKDTVVWNAPGFKMLKSNSASGPDYLGVYTIQYWNQFRAKKSPADAAAERTILEKFGSPADDAATDNPPATGTKSKSRPGLAAGYPPATETFLTFTNVYGTVFDHVKVTKILPDGVYYSLSDGTGGGKIALVDLPPESQQALRYSARAAAGRGARP